MKTAICENTNPNAMIVSKRKWMFIASLATMIRQANVQFVLPFPPLGSIFPLPPPPRSLALPPPPQFQVMLPSVSIHLPNGANVQTTTTTEQSIAVAFPMPMPLPVQVAIPALPPPLHCQLRPILPSCPPCPPCVCSPSCTPSFFSYCSSCHQKCRCRNRDDVPEPIRPRPPMPVPGPAYPMVIPPGGSPSVVVVPYDSYRSPKGNKKKYSSESSESSEDDSSSREICRRGSKDCRRTRRRPRNSGRNSRRTGLDNEIKPVLSYISRNGDVRLRQRISNDDAADLLEDDRNQRAHFISHPQGNAVFMPNNMEIVPNDFGIVVPKKEHIIGAGKKELIFRPADHKTISNLSVVFQVV